MRRLALLTLLSLTLAPGLALAQNDATPPPGGPPPDGVWAHHGDKRGHGGWGHHQDWGPELLDKFYAANTAHDGRLTLAQAKAADLRTVVDHFTDIDLKHRGYVTFYDIQAWQLDDMARHLEAKADELRAKD